MSVPQGGTRPSLKTFFFFKELVTYLAVARVFLIVAAFGCVAWVPECVSCLAAHGILVPDRDEFHVPCTGWLLTGNPWRRFGCPP